ASDAARPSVALVFCLLGFTGLVALSIAIVVVTFVVRYRKASAADRANAPSGNRALEIAWIAAPLAAFVGFFTWGAVVYAGLYGGDATAIAVFVVGKQWMWRVQHE